jgi:hypothetical protein
VPGDAKGTRALHGQPFMQSQDTQAAGSAAPTSQTVTAIGEQDRGKQREDLSGSGSVTNVGQGSHHEGNGSGGAAAAVVAGDIDGFDNDLANDIPPTSPPPSPSVATKRRFSTVDGATASGSGGDSDITSLVQNSSSSTSKRGRVSGAVALTSIGHSLTGFASVYRKGIEMQQARHEERVARRGQGTGSSDDSVSSQAMDKAQTVETDLSADELATLLENFEDEKAANAYLRIKGDDLRGDDLRKAWVKRKLAAAAQV